MLCSQAFGGTIAAVDDLSRTGEALANIIGAEVLINPRADAYDLMVVVDTAVRLQLGQIRLEKYALVDHHLDEGMRDGAEFYIQKPCKIHSGDRLDDFKENGKRVTRKMALGLLVGMISDTGRFKRAAPETFRAAAELLEMGEFDYEEALQALSVPPDLSQRIAVLKAASRAEIERQGDWLVASTQINSFEGSAAMALVDLGADVAFAAGRHGDRVRVSARSSRAAVKMGLDLNELLGEVGRAHGGDGGGHKAAAALEARGEPRALLQECRKKVADRLKLV